MAHRGKVTKERIVRVEGLFSRHDADGYFLPPSSAIQIDSERWIPVRDARDHGTFHLRRAEYHDGQTPEGTPIKGYLLSSEGLIGYAYIPLDPSMSQEDIEGATYAQDTGTHWMFAHCSPHEQIDFAAEAERFCYSAFDEQIDRAQSGTSATAAARARALVDFASQAGREVFNTVRRATLGEYHRNPHHDHKRDLAVSAINKVWAAWQNNGARLTDRKAIETAFGQVRMRLDTDYVIEWRHERAPVWIAQGRDPVSGREWCFTLAATNDPITGEANLPDPNWHFDAFGNGITKGTQRYTDGEPRPTQAEPWIIRFYRPTPQGMDPAPGTSMGSVEWTQETAYQPS